MEQYLNLNVDQLIAKFEETLTEKSFSVNDIFLIKNAISFAQKQHEGQYRKSGEPYIIHPLCTALQLIEWNMDVNTIVAGLFHDLLEDTNTSEQQIATLFNEHILSLVKWVTKVTDASKQNIDLKNTNEQDKKDKNHKYIIDLILSMPNDPRAIIIKLADRLHNIYTLEYLPPDKQQSIAYETLYIFANIAGRLGMYQVKTLLLDGSFKYLNPKAYNNTLKQFDNLLLKNNDTWLETLTQIKTILDSYNIVYNISYRYKGIYSTYLKLKKNYHINDIHDIFAIRIVLPEVIDCYKVLGYIHTNFKNIPQTFKDYISNPKLNLYQSIHTSIVINKIILEIQIRTNKMDDFANYGLAAHWKYKEDYNSNFNSATKYISSYVIPEIISENTILNTTIQPYDVMIKNSQELLITNPNNTCLDIAYMYDKNLFNKLQEVKVNGRKTTFDYIPKKKDNIEFSYSDELTVKVSWCTYALNENTKKFIKSTLIDQMYEKDISVVEFYQTLENKLKDKWIGKIQTKKVLSNFYNFNSVHEFVKYMINNKIDINEHIYLFSKLKSQFKNATAKFSSIYSQYLLFSNYLEPVPGINIRKVEFSMCCNKVPGKTIFGVINSSTLYVHDYNCVKNKKLIKSGKIIPLEWNLDKVISSEKYFPYSISFTTGYTISLSNFISEQLMNFKIPYNKIEIHKVNNEFCIINLDLLINNADLINELIELFKGFNINVR